jgi:aspartyl-tRNA(Asn)/glutamyl-tRNA(Gln) amidotransferase subunit B
MKEILEKYEPVIGLEIHVQLDTKTKAYASEALDYGASPNTLVSPISLGHPGTLPKANQQVVEYAVRLGLACSCDIRERNEYARKNYFYVDLPKGYQITQDTTPICTGGFVEIKDAEGKLKKIGLTRIHMEEDSGKSIHDIDPFNTLVDLNRAGTPLLEIVSEPEFKNGQEAYNYLSEMRKLVRYLDISDGNMEEGSLRCDVNISIKPIGRKKFGTKVEVKNMNSFRNVQKAIDYEIKRQYELIESGGEVEQQTMNFDATTGKTILLRAKEDAHDYRYFPEPDLQPVMVRQDYIKGVQDELPPLPKQLFEKYKKLNLSDYDAGLLTDTKEIALFFEDVIENTKQHKTAANWMMGPIKSYLNDKALNITDFPVSPKKIAQLIEMVAANQVSNSAASGELLRLLIENPEANPEKLAEEHNLLQESDSNALEALVTQALDKYPDKVEAYKAGKKGLMGLFVGEVMKLSKGKADPKLTNQILQDKLDN